MEMRSMIQGVWAAMVLMLALTGCASMDTLRKNVDADAQRSGDIARAGHARMDDKTKSSRSDLPWLGQKLLDRPKNRLPAAFTEKITFGLDRQVTLPQIAAEITRITGIPVRISGDVVTTTATPPAAAGSSAAAAPTSQQSWDSQVEINFAGVALTEILDQVAAKTGISWDYREKDGAIYFSRYVTKTFTLHILPGMVSQQASVGKSGSASTGAGGASSGGSFSSNSTSSVSSSMDSWVSTEAAIRSMLTSSGKVAVSQGTQTITVTDVRDTVDRVGQYVDRVNRIMTRLVTMKVDVVSVTLSNSSEMGINWTTVYNRLNAVAPNLSVTIAGAAQATGTGAGTASIGIIAPTGGVAGQYDGTTAMFSALAVAGKTSVVNTSRIMTLNNQPAPVAITDQQSYIASTTAAAAPAAGAAASAPGLNVSNLTTGYILNVLPSMLSESELLLQFSVDISSLKRMSTFVSAGQTVQQPEISSVQFMQRAKLNFGETVFISGYTRKVGQADQRGMFDPANWMAGGGNTGSHQTEELVIMITPLVSD